MDLDTPHGHIIIVGGGQAGAVAASALRGAGHCGLITLIGDEHHLPYERPPLSKEVLVKPESAKLTIQPDSFYRDNGIDIRLGLAARHLDAGEKRLDLESGESLRFDKLLLATGARARPYPLLDRLGDGIHRMRTLDDAESLRGHLWPGRRLLVIGGGVIGLEVAASAVAMGASVGIIERGSRLMARAAPDILARRLLSLHQEHGVAVDFDAELTEAEKTASGEIMLRCRDGRTFTGDLAVYGIGIEPNVDLAVSAGLRVEDGIVVDEWGRSSHPDIYAAGDVARQWSPARNAYIRQETWANAQNQGNGIARAMVTGEPCPVEIPWFWTDQFGLNIQVAGASDAEEWIARGDVAANRYTLFGVTHGLVVSAVTVNNGREMRPAKALIAQRARVDDPGALADPKRDLRHLAAQVA